MRGRKWAVSTEGHWGPQASPQVAYGLGPVPCHGGEGSHSSTRPQSPTALRLLSAGPSWPLRAQVLIRADIHLHLWTLCKLCPPISSPSNRDPHMELREEAWSPGPLDSEDQQMASHENPGEVVSGSSQWTPCPPSWILVPLASLPVALGSPICSRVPGQAASWAGRVSKFPFSSTSLGTHGGCLLTVSC